MNPRDQDSDTSSIDETNLPDGMHVIEETNEQFESEFDDVIKKIQSSVKAFSQKGADITQVREAVKQALRESVSGSKKIESTSERTVEGDTMNARKQKVTSLKKSTPTEVETTPVTVLPSTSGDLRAETLTSMNLIKSSAQHLHDLMKSVVQPPPDEHGVTQINPMRLADTERAKVSAIIAKQFYSVMRLQFDAIKLVKELEGYK